MERNGIARRSRSEATYRKANPTGDPFTIKSRLSLNEERLKALALRVHLILHEGDNIKRAMDFSTCIPVRGRGTYRSRVLFGTAGVYVHNSKFRQLIGSWLEEYAHVAQLAEHVVGNDEVAGSIPAVGFDGYNGNGLSTKEVRPNGHQSQV